METKRARSSGNNSNAIHQWQSNAIHSKQINLTSLPAAAAAATTKHTISLIWLCIHVTIRFHTLSLFHLPFPMPLFASLFVSVCPRFFFLLLLGFLPPKTSEHCLFNWCKCMCTYTMRMQCCSLIPNAPDHAALLFMCMYWCLSSPWIFT